MLDDVEKVFWDHFHKSEEEQIEDMTEMLDALLSMDVIQNQELPEEMSVQLGMLAEMGILPEHLEKKIYDLLYSKGTKKQKRKKSGKKRAGGAEAVSRESYVISVSLMPGCYRHIQISGNSTLKELHSVIVDAFDFMDDHAHAFFMDNRAWSDEDCYYIKGVEEYEPTTDEYKLCQMNLYKGMQFKYVFDFGTSIHLQNQTHT